MAEYLTLGPAVLDALDDRGGIRGIGEDDTFGDPLGQRRDGRFVGDVSRREEQRATKRVSESLSRPAPHFATSSTASIFYGNRIPDDLVKDQCGHDRGQKTINQPRRRYMAETGDTNRVILTLVPIGLLPSPANSADQRPGFPHREARAPPSPIGAERHRRRLLGLFAQLSRTPVPHLSHRSCSARGPESLQTLCWREMDSNPRSPISRLTQTRSNGDVQHPCAAVGHARLAHPTIRADDRPYPRR